MGLRVMRLFVLYFVGCGFCDLVVYFGGFEFYCCEVGCVTCGLT